MARASVPKGKDAVMDLNKMVMAKDHPVGVRRGGKFPLAKRWPAHEARRRSEEERGVLADLCSRARQCKPRLRSPQRRYAHPLGGWPPEGCRSYAQVVQESRDFKWEAAWVVAALEMMFTQVVVYLDEEIDRSLARWKNALVGKFLGRGFLQNLYRKRCNSGEISKRIFMLHPFLMASCFFNAHLKIL